MRTLIPCFTAACALIAVPASAQAQSAGHHAGGTHWSTQSAFGDGHGNDGRNHRDGRRHRNNVVAVTHSYGGEWALYNNRSWAPDSYNDWWHDRPDRAYPRWIQNNQDCKRIWWSGGGWRC